MKILILTTTLILSLTTLNGQSLQNAPDSIKMDCAVASKFLDLTGAMKTHFSKNSPTFTTLDSFYKNGLGIEYYRSYRDKLPESALEFYDTIFEDLATIMADLRVAANNAERKAGMVMIVSFANSDLENRKKKLCIEK